MGLKQSDILRAEVRRLETALKNNDAFLERIMEKAGMCEQALGVVMHLYHPEGLTITEEQRVACGKATMFRVSLDFVPGEDGEGSMVLKPRPITEEEREKLRAAKAASRKGPDIILPGGEGRTLPK